MDLAVATVEVGDAHLHDPVLVQGVALLDQRAVVPTLHGDAGQVTAVAQDGVEGEENLGERDEISGGATVLVEVGVLDVAVPPDVVGRAISTGGRAAAASPYRYLRPPTRTVGDVRRGRSISSLVTTSL